jgi:hypothetical protein
MLRTKIEELTTALVGLSVRVGTSAAKLAEVGTAEGRQPKLQSKAGMREGKQVDVTAKPGKPASTARQKRQGD